MLKDNKRRAGLVEDLQILSGGWPRIAAFVIRHSRGSSFVICSDPHYTIDKKAAFSLG